MINPVFKTSCFLFFIGIESVTLTTAQTSIIIQAEIADTIYHGSIDNNHSGYTGFGFVNLDNEEGSYIVWNLELPQGGDFHTIVRFANAGDPRTMHIYVNDTMIEEDFSFPSTTDWTIWDTISFNTSLIAGLNTIKMVGSNPQGGPNLDYISFTNPYLTLNFEPVAINDSVTISTNQAIPIDVLVNDYDYNGDGLIISSFTQPLNGTIIELENNEGFRYKPDLNFSGSDEFSYTITDGSNEDTAQVIITIDYVDWSIEVADMIVNTKTPETVGSWDYAVALLLEGMLRVYKRTNDERYLTFINNWADLHISATGEVDAHLNSLDNMMPGFMLLHLYSETNIEKYKLTCDSIRHRYDTYPRTSDSGFWHGTANVGELWLDGLYMSMPFMATYGKMFYDEEYTYSEAIRQFTVYLGHLMNEETGILLHAYDEDGSSSWALPPHNRSPHHWGRSIGWVVMGLTEVLDIIPPEFPNRDTLVELYTTVLQGLAKYQDTTAGLWYQVVDRADSSKNWHETSCTMMYTLAMKRAIQKALLDSAYNKNVELGYMGALSKISKAGDGMVYLTDICQGTGVSADMDYYFNRARNTNDNHGLGSFLIMNEFIAHNNLAWYETTLIHTPKGISKDLIVEVYPNPCQYFIELSIQNEVGQIAIELFTITGEKVKHEEWKQCTSNNKIRITTDDLQNGIYLCKVNTSNGTRTMKIILSKF